MPQTAPAQNSHSEVDADPAKLHDIPPGDGGDSGSTESSDPAGSSAEAIADEDTGVPLQNQAETPVAPPPKVEETLQERMTRRQAQVEADLYEREAFILKYVRERFPFGYYKRAITEGNEFFQQAVIYRLRRHRHGKTPPKR